MYSKNRYNKKWSRNETILALELYYRTPFGRIHNSNPDIRLLANHIGRTADAVSLKMSNLAHHDPSLRKRNISGMAHGSKLDAEIFNEFIDDFELLVDEAERIKIDYKIMTNIADDKTMKIEDINKEGYDQYTLHKMRVNQDFFRKSVLSSYDNRCCITGINVADLLIASHIKPWKSCDKNEKINPANGLCLNPFHDKAFDNGYFTIDSDYRIRVSPMILRETNDYIAWWLIKLDKTVINLPDRFLPNREFLEYHYDKIFKHCI